MGVLATVDQNALARYCSMFAVWRECTVFCEKNGCFYVRAEDDDGVRRQRPEARLARELAQDLAKIESAFAMDPAARSRVKIPAKSAYEAEKQRKIDRYFPEAM
jgi:P27 family predicted phage terminase small subunit